MKIEELAAKDSLRWNKNSGKAFLNNDALSVFV